MKAFICKPRQSSQEQFQGMAPTNRVSYKRKLGKKIT